MPKLLDCVLEVNEFGFQLRYLVPVRTNIRVKGIKPFPLSYRLSNISAVFTKVDMSLKKETKRNELIKTDPFLVLKMFKSFYV